MQKRFFLTVASTVLLAGCARHVNDPYEVVDESYVHRYGVPIAQQEWASQGETGKVVSTLKSGIVVSRSYANGALDGDTTYTYPHSDLIERTETYSQGNLNKETQFYRNGTVSQETLYTSPTTRDVTLFYDNGSTQGKERYENNTLTFGDYLTLNGTKESQVQNGKGLRTRRDAFGNISGVDKIENGLVIETKTFHPNGTVKQTIPYANGEVNGQLKTFLPGGEPYSIETWTVGERTGPTYFFENGEKIAEVPYVRGVKDGMEKHYRNGEIVVEEISWVQDTKHGPSVTKINGRTNVDYYLQGKQVSQATFEKYANGSLQSSLQ